MNRLPIDKRVLILHCLVEGMSIRSTARVADVSKNTVLKLLVDAGRACSDYQDRVLRELPCRRIEVDEIWSFVYAKNKNVAEAKNPPQRAGDVWTWTSMCPDTKLVPSWCVGDRTAVTANEFMHDLRDRLANRVQLTSDGYNPYLEAVEDSFGCGVDYAMLVKQYGPRLDEEGNPKSQNEYFKGSVKEKISGHPNRKLISTSAVERQNLTMRMSMKRFTRKTNAFSKKIRNHAAAISLHFMHYNFSRIHQTIQVTPAMEAGITRRLWEIRDIVDLTEASLPKPGPRGPYKKRAISN